MVRLINFSDQNMTRSQVENSKSAMINGVDQVLSYNPSFISEDFRAFNNDILSAERGAGYWLWKPYFINKAFALCNDGDILIYSDSGLEIIARVENIINVMDQDIFLFTSGHLNREWCKTDVIAAINEHMEVETLQAQASVIFFKVNDFTRKFVKEWLLWCQMPGLIDDSPSILPNHASFKEHRHDQAILTSLAYKYGLTLHWWADALWFENQRHRWPDDKYPSMFRHHRKRNNEW